MGIYGQYPQQMNNYYQQPTPIMQSQQQRLMQMEQMYPQFSQQQYMSQQQPQYLNGRIIDDVSTVNANEVLMDGSVALFPMRDMSKIFAKKWNQNGVIETVTYEPVLDDKATNSTLDEEKLNLGAFNEFTGTLLARIDELEKKIDGMTMPKPTTQRTKKEVE